MAGLNFVGNACYQEVKEGAVNVAQYEFIPWVLSQCATLKEAKQLIQTINLVKTPYNEHLPAASLHWIIADQSGCITVESVEEGLKIYENPVGVLANNPSFDKQLFNLNNYMSLSPKQPQNYFSKQLDLKSYSRGMGALGLPGDLSSMSRFVRVAFTKMNGQSKDNERDSVNQFFHILGSVEQQRGCCEVDDGKYEITIYTSCWNSQKGIYYYTTYNRRQITAVNMHKVNLDGQHLTSYPMLDDEEFYEQN